jgi:hypothetical protein
MNRLPKMAFNLDFESSQYFATVFKASQASLRAYRRGAPHNPSIHANDGSDWAEVKKGGDIRNRCMLKEIN